jgi:hypothetical protein
VVVLSVTKNSRLLVMKNHQRLMSSVIDTCCECGSRCRGMVHSANMTLSSTSGPLIENHVHLPLVALATQWDLLANVERLNMVVKGQEQ